MKPIRINDLISKEIKVNQTGELLSSARSLSDAFGIESLLVHQETLLPGRRASSPHFHSAKEEIFIVISGNPSLWINGKVIPMQPGDAVGFNRDNSEPRMICNDSQEAAVILTIGTNPPEDRVTFLSDSEAIEKAVEQSNGADFVPR